MPSEPPPGLPPEFVPFWKLATDSAFAEPRQHGFPMALKAALERVAQAECRLETSRHLNETKDADNAALRQEVERLREVLKRISEIDIPTHIGVAGIAADALIPSVVSPALKKAIEEADKKELEGMGVEIARLRQENSRLFHNQLPDAVEVERMVEHRKYVEGLEAALAAKDAALDKLFAVSLLPHDVSGQRMVEEARAARQLGA